MDTGAIASRTTYVTGNAIRLAAEKAKEILFQVAAPMLGVKPEQLEARDRKIQVKNYPQRCIGIGEVANQAQFVAMCKALGHPEWSVDPRFIDNGARMTHMGELRELFSAVLRTRTRTEWEAVLDAAGVPSGPINDYAQAMAHPQAQHLGTRIGIPHAMGVEAPGIASPMRFSKTPVEYRLGPPMLGQHTREVLGERLGLAAGEIDRLEAARVIACARAA